MKKTPGSMKTRKDPFGVSREEIWDLRLYVTGHTGKSRVAFLNLKKICEEHLAGRFNIEVIDLLRTPLRAKHDQIIIVPTLVKDFPGPKRTIFGDLSNTERVLSGLDVP